MNHFLNLNQFLVFVQVKKKNIFIFIILVLRKQYVRFSEKATEIWRNIPLSFNVKQRGSFPKIVWPSYNEIYKLYVKFCLLNSSSTKNYHHNPQGWTEVFQTRSGTTWWNCKVRCEMRKMAPKRHYIYGPICENQKHSAHFCTYLQ